jgi:hypothetical protein
MNSYLKIGNPKNQKNKKGTIPEYAKILSMKNLFKTGLVEGIQTTMPQKGQ